VVDALPQVLLLLGLAVVVVGAFLRLGVPSILGYLLVGVILGPYTVGPVIQRSGIERLAEFGIVFLLFTIGLSFSPPELRALGHRVLWLGAGQVALTTAVVGLLAWWAGMTPAVAFAVGAVFAQSSTTIIGRQLEEQGEENSHPGRLGLAMSVTQDVTAVPFVIILPVLGAALGAGALAGELAWAMAKAAVAIAAILVVGRWAIEVVFHVVARWRSAELFTLAVLFVALSAAAFTNALGLSLAFGSFLAGMILGETEFRHQVRSSIRPFRDVLLGLFFVAVGMLFDPSALPGTWPWALLGTVVLLGSKAVIVAGLVVAARTDLQTALRTGLLLAVGGEFGLALLAIAFNVGVVDSGPGQVVLTSVLLSMVAGTFLIRYNQAVARALTFPLRSPAADELPRLRLPSAATDRDHVIIAGYGRIGQAVARLLQQESISYIAVDLDSSLVRQAHAAGEPVYYGDASSRDVLDSLGLQSAELLVISHDDPAVAVRTLTYLKTRRPEVPVLVRSRDEDHVEELEALGAREVVPETLEAALTMASEALLLLRVPPERVMDHIQRQRSGRYRLLRELYRRDDGATPRGGEPG
jgi:monovalent cation:H+ antiporter-2, CPA2 family